MTSVKDQYENYPYPARDPADELTRLVEGSPSSLLEIDHYLFGGKRDWSQPFRVLVAGGGTGDALIMLSQHLKDIGCPAEVTYLDLSTASRAIAEARAAAREIDFITFHTGSLLDAADYGSFDYIDCCGVLHHLPDPDAGFAALKKALATGGGMGIMLYGELGRTGVYDMQEMLHTLSKEDEAPARKVEVAKSLLKLLPETNRFHRNTYLSDHKQNDAGLFDLLLHSQDRAYRVHEIYEALKKAGLEMVSLFPIFNYDPDFLVADPQLRERLSQLSLPEREAFAELFLGNFRTHMFYCAHEGEAAGRTATFSPDMMPVMNFADGPSIAKVISKGQPLRGDNTGLKLTIPLPPAAAPVLQGADGTRSFEDLRGQAPREAYYDMAQKLFRILSGLNIMLLRAPR